MAKYDVLTFGETMLRLTPPGYLRIEQTNSFDIWVGGTESNTAIGLARLGMKTAWFSRLPASPMGYYVSNRVRQYGVDVSHIVWAQDERLGIFFHEKSQSPRSSRIIYDRKDSAVSRIQPADLPADLFRHDMSRLFHVTGITLAISVSARATALAAMRSAKNLGWQLSFDTNYRSTLWSGQQAARGCDKAMALADIIFCPYGDYKTLYDDARPDEALATLAAKYPATLIIMTLGKDGAAAIAADGERYRQPAILAGEIGRIGGGDAFAAGFLYTWLTDADVALALKWGVAMSAHKYTIPGDLPLVDYDEVAALAHGAGGGGLIR